MNILNKKQIKIPLTLLFLLFISTSSFSQVIELSGEECQTKIDSFVNNFSYNKAIKKISSLCLLNPNNEIALGFLYRLRQDIKKNDLEIALNKLSDKMRLNGYAKGIDIYIKNKQLKKGDKYFDFNATTTNNKVFVLSETVQKKDVLLIFYGIGCMGKDTRDYLKDLYGKLNLNKVEIVSVSLASNVEELLREKNKYGIPWEMISDFEGVQSKAKIIYNVQERPNAVYIDSDGIIIINQTAIRKGTIKLLEKNKMY